MQAKDFTNVVLLSKSTRQQDQKLIHRNVEEHSYAGLRNLSISYSICNFLVEKNKKYSEY